MGTTTSRRTSYLFVSLEEQRKRKKQKKREKEQRNKLILELRIRVKWKRGRRRSERASTIIAHTKAVSHEWGTSERMKNAWSWDTLPERTRSLTNRHSKIYLPVNRDHRLGQLGPSWMMLIDLLDRTSSRRLRHLMSGLRATVLSSA